jgi:hypothetical protein
MFYVFFKILTYFDKDLGTAIEKLWESVFSYQPEEGVAGVQNLPTVQTGRFYKENFWFSCRDESGGLSLSFLEHQKQHQALCKETGFL